MAKETLEKEPVTGNSENIHANVANFLKSKGLKYFIKMQML